MKQNYINHIALVLDASASMAHLSPTLIRVADAQIAYLAQRSKELDQETRVTVYAFSDQTTCLVYDKDVLRLPSVASLYRAAGNTALIDASLKALDDLGRTATLYGDHAFLTYVLTDGEENRSTRTASDLVFALRQLADNWTVAVFVPNQQGVFEAKKFGFPSENIAVWDATTVKGVEAMGERIRQTTDTFMRARATGTRGSRNLFSLRVDALGSGTLGQTLPSLRVGQYRMLPVEHPDVIIFFVERHTQRAYRRGEAYYELTKTETIQGNKQLAIYDTTTRQVYTGGGARALVGLPDYTVRVNPVDHPHLRFFVQSTSVNRNLLPGTAVLLLS